MKNKIGSVFGRLTVVEQLPSKRHPCGKTSQCFLAKCTCGNTSEVLWSRLASGKTTSCGCYRVEASRLKQITHGMRATPEYAIWCAMRSRTSNPNSRVFRIYGGRGISVCQRWKDSFEAFIADVGRRPSPKHSLERLDVNGDYTPENVVWASMKTQQRNRRNNHMLTIGSETKCLAEWAEISGIQYATLLRRVKVGWSPYDAVFAKVR